MARLQNEVVAKDVFSRHEFSHEKCSDIFPEIFEPYSVGQKRSHKIPAKFPAKFPYKKSRKIHRRASAGAQGELFDLFLRSVPTLFVRSCPDCGYHSCLRVWGGSYSPLPNCFERQMYRHAGVFRGWPQFGCRLGVEGLRLAASFLGSGGCSTERFPPWVCSVFNRKGGFRFGY